MLAAYRPLYIRASAACTIERGALRRLGGDWMAREAVTRDRRRRAGSAAPVGHSGQASAAPPRSRFRSRAVVRRWRGPARARSPLRSFGSASARTRMQSCEVWERGSSRLAKGRPLRRRGGGCFLAPDAVAKGCCLRGRSRPHRSGRRGGSFRRHPRHEPRAAEPLDCLQVRRSGSRPAPRAARSNRRARAREGAQVDVPRSADAPQPGVADGLLRA